MPGLGAQASGERIAEEPPRQGAGTSRDREAGAQCVVAGAIAEVDRREERGAGHAVFGREARAVDQGDAGGGNAEM